MSECKYDDSALEDVKQLQAIVSLNFSMINSLVELKERKATIKMIKKTKENINAYLELIRRKLEGKWIQNVRNEIKAENEIGK